MKAWLVTWKGVGNHACVKNPVAAILNSRLGSERVRRIVERTYVNARFSLSERLHYASSRRWRNPYPARFSSLHGVTWRGRVYCGDNPGEPAETGTRDANSWGLYDVHGNVWEWCHDWWNGADYAGDATDPWGNASGSTRALRGSAWDTDPENLRSAYRFTITPALSTGYLGFRLTKSE